MPVHWSIARWKTWSATPPSADGLGRIRDRSGLIAVIICRHVLSVRPG